MSGRGTYVLSDSLFVLVLERGLVSCVYLYDLRGGLYPVICTTIVPIEHHPKKNIRVSSTRQHNPQKNIKRNMKFFLFDLRFHGFVCDSSFESCSNQMVTSYIVIFHLITFAGTHVQVHAHPLSSMLLGDARNLVEIVINLHCRAAGSTCDIVFVYCFAMRYQKLFVSLPS